jgi:putative membrane protein
MIRSARWLFLAAMLPIAACASNTPAPVAVATPVPPPLAAADQTFVNAAASSDAAEVQLGQLAATKAHNPRIKTFASTMVTAHTQTTQQLQTIAQSKGVTPDATLSPAAQAMLKKLTAAHPGAAFDRDYIRNQVAAHMAAVQAFQAEIASGSDADLKAFATSTLPTVQSHLKMARQLAGMRH